MLSDHAPESQLLTMHDVSLDTAAAADTQPHLTRAGNDSRS